MRRTATLAQIVKKHMLVICQCSSELYVVMVVVGSIRFYCT
jgi:hypothetical protein